MTKGNDLGDQREDLDDQRKDLNESKAAMPQRVKQTGWAKPNQLPKTKNGKGWAIAQPAARRA